MALWSKNGQELTSKDGAKISFAHNHVKLELKNVNVKDAGRYTCTVNNDVGSASSTADLVVKSKQRYGPTRTYIMNTFTVCPCTISETIFPPVFGKRLKAQVVKKGDRVIMEVEITGIPEPTVTWYKNDMPINKRPPELKIIQQGNCYTLVIDKGEFPQSELLSGTTNNFRYSPPHRDCSYFAFLIIIVTDFDVTVKDEDAGKYMVRATNAGGEAQSIADVAVFQPHPDTMVEVHKTVIYENVQGKGVVQVSRHLFRTILTSGDASSRFPS